MKLNLTPANGMPSFEWDYSYGAEEFNLDSALHGTRRVQGHEEFYIEMDGVIELRERFLSNVREDRRVRTQQREIITRLQQENANLEEELAKYKTAVEVIQEHGKAPGADSYEQLLEDRNAQNQVIEGLRAELAAAQNFVGLDLGTEARVIDLRARLETQNEVTDYQNTRIAALTQQIDGVLDQRDEALQKVENIREQRDHEKLRHDERIREVQVLQKALKEKNDRIKTAKDALDEAQIYE